MASPWACLLAASRRTGGRGTAAVATAWGDTWCRGGLAGRACWAMQTPPMQLLTQQQQTMRHLAMQLSDMQPPPMQHLGVHAPHAPAASIVRHAVHAATSTPLMGALGGRQQASAAAASGPFRRAGALRGYQDVKGYTHFERRGTFGWFTGWARWVVGGSAAALGLYYLSCLETVPFTGRRHSLMFVSRSQELAMGRTVFEMEREQAAAMRTLLPDRHPYSRLVRSVGARVAAVAGNADVVSGRLDHMQGLNWEYAVVQSSTPNAFVVPGGKVVVYTGLLDLLSSEDEVAAIIAHETAHVLARHHAEKMSTMNVFALWRMFLYAAFGISVPTSLLLLGFGLPYSRQAEYEADAIGLRLMSAACYNPLACPSMLTKLAAKEKQLSAGRQVPEFLRTHPLTNARVEKVRKALPEAAAEYERRCGAPRAAFAGAAAAL